MAFVAFIALLWLGALRRIQRDRLRKHRALVNRRDKIRAELTAAGKRAVEH